MDNTGNSTPPMNSCIIKSRSLEDILRVSSPPFQLRKLIKLIGFRVLLRRLLQGRLLRLFRVKYFIASILLLLLSWRVVTYIYRPRGRVGTFFHYIIRITVVCINAVTICPFTRLLFNCPHKAHLKIYMIVFNALGAFLLI